MNENRSELWCEHEFIVLVNRGSVSETHLVSVYGDSELIEDIVTDDVEDRLTKKITAVGPVRDEVEFNQYGQVLITRHVEPGELGTIKTFEASHGSMRSERTTVRTVDGRSVMLTEQLFTNGCLKSQSETNFCPDGNPSLTVTSTYAQDGRVVGHQQIVWHAENRPAISETTEFDWYGCAEVYTKTLHNTNGSPLWEERVQYPENSARPSKKEVFLFNSKSERSCVDVSEYGPNGEVQQHAIPCAPANTAGLRELV